MWLNNYKVEESTIKSREIIETEDGTSTLRLVHFDEQFHSIHGAMTESMHIYINNGLLALPRKEEIRILEVGFGTGLNALLTLIHSYGRKVNYHAVEAYPLLAPEIELLNYTAHVDSAYRDAFYQMHHISYDGRYVNEDFYFKKTIDKIENIDLPDHEYDLVYYDAFSPVLQPELWTKEIFGKIYRSMSENAILVTYCAKGSIKRIMKEVKFELESLPGPPGKREISRCEKLIN